MNKDDHEHSFECIFCHKTPNRSWGAIETRILLIGLLIIIISFMLIASEKG